MFADYQNFWRLLDNRLNWYRMNHGTELSSTAIASLVSRMLYEKRFFPCYAFNLVVGFNDEDKPVIWKYDAIGSYGEVTYGVAGSSKFFLLPLLDNQLENYNGIQKPEKKTVEQGVQLLIDGFSGCTERDINTGDRVDLVILNKDGTSEHRTSPLRFD